MQLLQEGYLWISEVLVLSTFSISEFTGLIASEQCLNGLWTTPESH
jgi:hypothetical protein